jgi:hypothetical protein
MKKLLFVLLIIGFTFHLNSQQTFCSELFISEYVEGWSNNKAIEIYNPTSSTIDLSQYFIASYRNGFDTITGVNSIQLNGFIAPHDVYVAVLDKRNPLGTGQEAPVWDSLQARADGFYCPNFADNNAFYWNGNDAIILGKGVLPSDQSLEINSLSVIGFQIVDVFGKIGENPANATGVSSGQDGAWSTVFPHNSGLGVLVTKDHSLIRKNTVLNGVTANPSFFDPLLQYDSIPAVTYIIDANGDTLFNTSGNPIQFGNWFSLGSHNCFCTSISNINYLNIQSCTSTYNLNGTPYIAPGTYFQISQDTLIEITLTYSPIQSNISVSSCAIPYLWNGQQYTQPGQYTQTFSNQFGCDSIVTLSLNFNLNDNILISPNPAFGNAPLNVAFANQTPNLSNYNFTWYFGDGTSQQSNSPFLSHIYTQNGYADVTVVADNLTTGCSSSQTFNDMIFVIGGVTCTHTATINQTSPLTGCVGDSILLSSNIDPSFTYQWNKNGIPVSGATSSSFYPTQSGSYTVTIYQNNCPVTSAGISVTMNSLPLVPNITSTGTIVPCSGGSMTLIAPSGLNSYLWNTGATTSSINVSQSGNYFVSVTNSFGCEQTSNLFPVNASNMAPTQVCIVGLDSLTNENRVVWEKPLTQGIDSFYVYKESNVSNVYTKIGATDYNDLAVFLDVNSNPAVQAYRYKISALDTCGVETNVGDFHKTIHLTINQGIGGAWNLIWSHYEGLSFGSYNIYRGTDPTNISLLTTIQSNLNSYTDLTPPSGAVYYQIEVVNPVNCDPTKVMNYGVSRSNIVNNGQIGVQEIKDYPFSVYPNPTNNDITLQCTNELVGQTYSILDFMGKIILKSAISEVKQQIDLTEIAKGTYYLIINEDNSKVRKIIKQ